MFLTYSFLFAQKQRPSSELGLFIGLPYYLGDMNHSHFKGSIPDKNLSFDKRFGPDLFIPATGVQFRRNFNHRISFKTSFLYGHVEAIDANSNVGMHQDRNISFRTDLFELSTQFEIYFHSMNVSNSNERFSPYFTTGLAGLYFNPQSTIGDSWVNTQPYNTEFQGGVDVLTEAPIEDYKNVQITVPLGIGFKWFVTKKLSISLEWGMRATFTDYLDDISTYYHPDLQGNTAIIADQSISENIKDYRQRGFANTNDWYNFTGFTISWLFQKDNFVCAD